MKRPSWILAFGCISLLLSGGAALESQEKAPAPSPDHRVQGTSQSAGQRDGATAAVGDEERSAVTFTGYDLTVHLGAGKTGTSVLARVVIRNDGPKPLAEVALQISSSLHWGAASETRNGRGEKLSFDQHPLQTDADRSGEASEAVLRLTKPLFPGGSTELTLLYSGSIAAPLANGGDAEVTSSSSGGSGSEHSVAGTMLLRGFGDVLWAPIASPQVFAGDGASLIHTSGLQMLRQAPASVHLRLSVEYTGEAPETAFFCGRQQSLLPSIDDADAPVAASAGVATAEFPVQKLGFRPLSLLVAGKPVDSSGGVVEVVTSDPAASERITALSAPIVRVLEEWLGGSQARVLSVVDEPGSPFAERSLLVMPVTGSEDATLNALLVPALTRARFRSEQAWLDQGMAEFLSLVWLERTQGRAAALQALEDEFHTLALAESVGSSGTLSEGSLVNASDAVFYRTKAAIILWQLRGIAGDDALKLAVQRYGRTPRLDDDPSGFETVLEQASGKKLRWFFDDWVYHDRALPELSLVSVAPRELSSKDSQGGGWLIAVEVRNDGGAVAEVPVTVSSGALTATERLRINAHSTASTRVLFQGVPQQVQVNDGTVPEMITSVHTQSITVR